MAKKKRRVRRKRTVTTDRSVPKTGVYGVNRPDLQPYALDDITRTAREAQGMRLNTTLADIAQRQLGPMAYGRNFIGQGIGPQGVGANAMFNQAQLMGGGGIGGGIEGRAQPLAEQAAEIAVAAGPRLPPAQPSSAAGGARPNAPPPGQWAPPGSVNASNQSVAPLRGGALRGTGGGAGRATLDGDYWDPDLLPGSRVRKPSLRAREAAESAVGFSGGGARPRPRLSAPRGGIMSRAGAGLRGMISKAKAVASPRSVSPRGGAVGRFQTKKKK